jgi:ABC-type transport system involved in multi-copper enzyme maturation permease subunit
VRALLAKELRQLGRSRRVLLSALLLPAVLMVGVPLAYAFQIQAQAPALLALLAPALPSGAADAARPLRLVTGLVLPTGVVAAGLVAPAATALHALAGERERGTLALLAALPVAAADLVLAKLLAAAVVTTGALLPLLAVDAAVLVPLGGVSPGYVLALLGVLVAAVAASTALALLVGLLARDHRTATNLDAALFGPLLLACTGLLVGAPEGLALGALTALLGGVALVAGTAALRWVSLARYLQ